MRLIDGDVAYRDIYDIACSMVSFPEGQEQAEAFHYASHLIEELPTIDAVPAIRCKDCKYWRQPNIILNGEPAWSGFCKHMDGVGDPEGFCYRAERREEECLNKEYYYPS